MFKKHSVSIIILMLAGLLILLPIWLHNPWHNLIHSIRFAAPSAPEYNVAKSADSNLIASVGPYSYAVAEGTPEIMLKLKAQGWPAYWQENHLYVGPFLDANQKKLNQQTLMELTKQKISIENYRMNG
jgi:hypothetical protein